MRTSLAWGATAAALLAAVPPVAHAADHWEIRGSVPVNRYVWSAADWQGRLFLFATDPDGTQNFTYEFVAGATAAADQWIPRAPKPGPVVAYFHVAELGGLVYLPGGGGPSSSSYDDLAIYDPATDSWSFGPDLPLPVNNYALAKLDGRLYLAGGCCGNRSDLFIFDPSTGWTTSPARLAVARNFPAGAAAGGRFLVIGGYFHPGTTRTDSVEAFDPSRGTWQALAPVPTGRSDHGAVACGERVFVVGGVPSSGGLLNTVEVYNADTGTWAGAPGVPQMPHAGTGECAVLHRGTLWVFPFSAAMSVPVQVLHAEACATNAAPIADAGADLSVTEGAQACLDGELSSDADEDALTYAWSQVAGPSVVLGDASDVAPCFTTPTVPAGGATLTFELIVSDGQVASAADQVDVVVRNVNHPPVADAGDDQLVAEAAAVTLDATQSYDEDGEPLMFAWNQVGGDGVTLGLDDPARPTFMAPLVGAAGADLVFEVSASDGTDASSDVVLVRVENVNHPPVADAGSDQTRSELALVTLAGCGSGDPDGDALGFTWQQVAGSPVSLSDPSACAPHFTAPVVGAGGETLVFRLTAADGLGGTDEDAVEVVVTNVNDPPSCALARASVARLWPPTHEMVLVRIEGVTDPDSDLVELAVTGVMQDEPTDGTGDGDTAPDAIVTSGGLLLRAERAGGGNGRVYRVGFEAVDTLGQVCSGSVTACVPHDRRAPQCPEDAAAHDSTH